MLDAPSHGLDSGNVATFELVQRTLASTSPSLDAAIIRQSGACTGTDGAYAPGGPSARHNPGFSVCQRLWASVGREDRSIWDDFHRQDKAGVKANALPCSEAFHTLTRFLEKLFGFGQGKILDRAISHRGGQPHLATRTASGTRKVVYMALLPRRFVDKFDLYFKGVLVRRCQARLNKGGFTCAELLAVAHQMCQIDMLVFVCALVTITENDIAPMALLTQGTQTLPWVRYRSAATLVEKMERREAELDAFKDTLRVFFLARPYMPTADWIRFYRVVIVAWHWRPLPVLVQHALPLLKDSKFKRCNVMPIPPKIPGDHPKEYRLCHPACQCPHRKAACLPHGELLPGLREHPRRPQASAPVCLVMGKHATFRVPTWCVSSAPSAVAMPLNFVGVAQRDLKTPGAHRGCSAISWENLEAWRRVEKGIDDALSWCRVYREEASLYQGDVGVAPFFQKAWALMADAWWFPSLLEKPQHSHELVKMPMALHEQRANALRVFAQRQAASPNAARPAQAFPPDTAPLISLIPPSHTPTETHASSGPACVRVPRAQPRPQTLGWRVEEEVGGVPSPPPPTPFPLVGKARAPSASLRQPCWLDCRQAFLALYKELLPDLSATAWPEGRAWAHVSREWPSEPDMLVQYKDFRAMLQKRARREADWFAVDRVIVCAWHPIVHAILLRARSEPRPACLILAYVGSYPAWCVRPDRVAPWAKSSRSALKCVKNRTRTAGGRFTTVYGRIVVVLREEKRLQQHKVCAAFETQANLSKKCWHVARMLHRCRHLGGNETPAEKWTGILKSLWNPVQGPCTRTIVGQLKLKAAGVRADGTDEGFVQGVAQSLAAPARPWLRAQKAGAIHAYRARQAQHQKWKWMQKGSSLSGAPPPRLASSSAWRTRGREQNVVYAPVRLGAAASKVLKEAEGRLAGPAFPPCNLRSDVERKPLAPSVAFRKRQLWAASAPIWEWPTPRGKRCRGTDAPAKTTA